LPLTKWEYFDTEVGARIYLHLFSVSNKQLSEVV
jgi:hypothetical protein